VLVHPALAEAIVAVSESGFWGCAYDLQWRMVAETAEQSATNSGTRLSGSFVYGPDLDVESPTGGSLELHRAALRHTGEWVMADLGVDRAELREIVHPILRDVVDDLAPCGSVATTWATPSVYFGDTIGVGTVAFRVRDDYDHVVGTLEFSKPGVGMNTIGMLTAAGDLHHFQQMHQLARADRRPAAVLFADLEGSAQLSRRMPTSAYFTLVRRMTRAADKCVIDAGGLVGRHIGDGVAAFFVAETAQSESAAAHACIAAARALQAAMLRIAEKHELPVEDVTIRAGLHWGATLYIGSIITRGRTEVTALGDEVNEAARIEACAIGGRLLASKGLIERLATTDAKRLGIDPNRIAYTQLCDLDTATEKARRDAPAVPVYNLAEGTP
jgi:class 3 adenylate cyclase